MKIRIPKLLLLLIVLLTATNLKAQVAAIGDLTSGTLSAYCPSEEVKLTATSTGSTYVWKRYPTADATGTATLLSETTASLVDTPPAPGYYTYVSTALNAEGCESDVSSPVAIYILPGITASIASSAPTVTEYCANALPTSLTLTATAGKAETVSETFAYKYQWYKGANAISGATSSTYVLNSTDDVAVGTSISYTVKITYQIKACTETTSSAISFDVLDLPTKPVITITP